MRRAAAVLSILWAGSVFAADSPAGLFGVAYEAGSTARVPQLSASEALPPRLEDLLPRPEVALPAPPPAPENAAHAVADYENLWDRIRDGFTIPQIESPAVDRWQAWYLARPQILKGILDRSRRYLFHVAEEVSKRGLPMELALLPIVESGYNPVAESAAQASGLWQFIPSTARDYNLPSGPDYDARRDVVASTDAALDYLRALHDQFGDWHLALAAYNWGEKSVAKAIERNAAKGLAAGYLALPLPEETRNYVPKLQALKNLIAEPAAYGLQLDPIANRPYFTIVRSDRALDAAVAARLAGVSPEELFSLNPGQIRPVVSGYAPAGLLVLPMDQAEGFIANLEVYRDASTAARATTRTRSPGSAPAKMGPRKARVVVQ